MNASLDAKLIAPSGINCGTCMAFFGYTMSGKRGNTLVVVDGHEQDPVPLSNRNVNNRQVNNSSIASNVLTFLAKR